MSPTNPLQNPIIYSPRNGAGGATRTMHGVLTLAAWMLYAYLWLPVITLLAWILGVRTTYIELYLQNNRFDNGIFLVILVLGVIATLLLVGWAEWNRHKFGGPDRRAPAQHVGADDVAQSLFAGADVSQRLTRAKSITLAMSEDARPRGIHRDVPMQGLL